jgi:hypothetical protein
MILPRSREISRKRAFSLNRLARDTKVDNSSWSLLTNHSCMGQNLSWSVYDARRPRRVTIMRQSSRSIFTFIVARSPLEMSTPQKVRRQSNKNADWTSAKNLDWMLIFYNHNQVAFDRVIQFIAVFSPRLSRFTCRLLLDGDLLSLKTSPMPSDRYRMSRQILIMIYLRWLVR